MECNCGGTSEAEHKVVRQGKVVATCKKCPKCGRILLTSGELPVEKDGE